MATLMQFNRDTEALGRFFPHGCLVLVTPIGSSAIVLPDADAQTSMCVGAHGTPSTRAPF